MNSIDSMQAELSVFQEYRPDEYEIEVSATAEVYRLINEYQLDDILNPLTQYFPDATNGIQALLSISHIYDISVQEIASVLISVKEQTDPVVHHKVQFEELKTESKLSINSVMELPDGKVKELKFGKFVTNFEFEDRILPDQWADKEHSVADWKRRAEIAEDISIYFAQGAVDIANSQSPIKVVESSEILKPYLDYADECLMVSEIIETKQAYINKFSTRQKIFNEILNGDFDSDCLYNEPCPPDIESMEKGRQRTNHLILKTWRDYSDRPALTFQEHRLIESERHEINYSFHMLAREITAKMFSLIPV